MIGTNAGPHRELALSSLTALARLDRPHELAARARHAAGDRGAARARRRGAGHRARLRADARAARALPDRPHGDRPPPRRQARRQGRSASRSRSGALVRWASGRRIDLALGHGSNDISVAAKLLRIPSATAFDYEWARVQHTINCRLATRVVVPDAIPPERLAPLRRDAGEAAAATRASRRSTTWRTSSPTPRCSTSSASTASEPLAVVRTPPAVSLYHRFEAPVFTQVLERLQGRAGRRAPAHATSSAPSSRARAASSSPSRRSTRSR